MAYSFYEQFAGPWEYALRTKDSSEWVSAHLKEHGQHYCIATYHMRVFAKQAWQPSYSDRIRLERSEGKLTAPINGKSMHVAEKRIAVAVKSTTQMPLPIFTIVNLTDIMNDYHMRSLTGNWEAAGIRVWRGGAGLAAFAFRIQVLCGRWAKEWARGLDELDGLLKVDVRLPVSHTLQSERG
jgi:hypothetical protein